MTKDNKNTNGIKDVKDTKDSKDSKDTKDNKASSRAYRPWQIKIFAATWLAYAGYYFCRKAFYIVKGDLADTMGLTTAHLAHLGTAYLVAYMIGQFSSAWFGRRLGPKLLLLVGMAISIACNVVFGVSNGFWTVMLFLSLNGLAQGTGWPGCIGSLAYWFRRKERGSILGVWSTCYQLGSIAAGSFAAFMLGLWGWRWSFFGASIVLLIIWFVVLVLHPNRPEDVGLQPLADDDENDEAESPDKNQKTTPTTNQNKIAKLGWTSKTITTILIMGTIYFCIKFLRYALWSWTPYFLNRNFDLAGDRAGYLSTVFDLTGFIGVLAAGFLSDRLFKGRRAFISFAMITMMALGFVFMYYLGAESVIMFAVSMGLVGFMLYGPDSLISGVGAIDVGSKRGALVAAGIINGMGSAGPVFQEQIIGWLYYAFDNQLGPILGVFVGVAAVAAALTFVLWLRARRGLVKL